MHFIDKDNGEMSMDYIRVTKDNLEKEHICCAISNNKDVQVSSKKAWLTDRFDEADNGIQLWYFPFDKGADAPRFKECARHPHIEEMGYVLYYTSQCSFNAKYVPVLEQTAKENNIPFHAIHMENREDAQNAPTPVTSYALFHDGEYVTNEQMNDKRFLKLIGQ